MSKFGYKDTILLLGNGFDISLNLPTSYICFMKTLMFLIDNKELNISNVGEVFGHINISKNDSESLIVKSYAQYKEVYDSCKIDTVKLSKMINDAEDNCWFSYFKNCLAKEMNWIDFESEIAIIIDSLKMFFESGNIEKSINEKTTYDQLRLMQNLSNFNKIFCKKTNINSFLIRVEEDYIDRNNERINSKFIQKPKYEKIVNYFITSLKSFSGILKSYFEIFVDYPARKMAEKGLLNLPIFLPEDAAVISFNYTNTYEYITKRDDIIHIHGNVRNNIVLGINPGSDDFSDNPDITYIKFKKYYQRAYYSTEDNYIEFINCEKNMQGVFDGYSVKLIVFGHSLDITDKDIIEDLFDIATEIKIYYHNDKAKENYIENIVRIYGKSKYDNLRRNKDLDLKPSETKPL